MFGIQGTGTEYVSGPVQVPMRHGDAGGLIRPPCPTKGSDLRLIAARTFAGSVR